MTLNRSKSLAICAYEDVTDMLEYGQMQFSCIIVNQRRMYASILD